MTNSQPIFLASGPALPRSFRKQPSLLSPTGWFAILALGAVATGATLAFVT
jgi:hypothetical protein